MAAELTTFLGTGDMTDTDQWLRAAARAVGGNPLHIANILSPDPNPYREKVLSRLRSERQIFLVREWETYAALGERKQAQIAGYVQSRLSKIISDDAMRNIFCQEPKVVGGHPAVDYARWMREGKTVVVKIPKKVFMKSGTPRVFHHQLVKIWLAKIALGAEGPTFLILNEIHQMLRANLEACVDLLEDIAVETRKYRLIPVFLFHDWAQVPKDLRDILHSAGPHLHLGASSRKTYEARLSKRSWSTSRETSARSSRSVYGSRRSTGCTLSGPMGNVSRRSYPVDCYRRKRDCPSTITACAVRSARTCLVVQSRK
jgi:hypothetical protein